MSRYVTGGLVACWYLNYRVRQPYAPELVLYMPSNLNDITTYTRCGRR